MSSASSVRAPNSAPENVKDQAKRVAVIGAGPIGIETALYAAALGHSVAVYEHGELAASVQTWGHVTLFSPWRMNVSALGLRTLQQAGQAPFVDGPDGDRCPTGAELVDRYLRPLSQSAALAGRVKLRQRVVAVGRPWLLKGDRIGQAARAEHGFHLLLQSSAGDGSAPPTMEESIVAADVVIDCSGTFGCPNRLGQGGIPAPGERALCDRIWHHVPDILGADRDRFCGRRVLVVGGGHSAATAATLLGQLLLQPAGQGTTVSWASRDAAAEPYPQAERAGDDPLRERRRLHLAANAVTSQPGMQYLPATVVSGLRQRSDGAVEVVLTRRIDPTGLAAADRAPATVDASPQGETQTIVVDEILGLTGYGPDRSIYDQLQVHECYASLGPMKLAATLLGASGDCMAQPTPGPETLRNPEHHFFIVGAKSYGRNSAFLLQVGHAQIRSVFQLLHGRPDLDLYAGQAATG